MSESDLTLADIMKRSHQRLSIKDCLFRVVMKKIRSGEELFPDIFGLDKEKRSLIEILITGKGVLLTGEYGVAKTELAKHLLILLNEDHAQEEVFFVEQCPVQEDPMTLAQFMALIPPAPTPALAEPCPICQAIIRDAKGDPAKIPVRRLDRLLEGNGYARVQGGGDVLPEEIVGTYNLLKLAEIGDPFDPRVFEPGKIGQSSRGLLFVDEIGKLSETAQHALIQSAQEKIMTPTKSRVTFPVDFLLVATTNYLDEEYICGAVRDRLVSLKIPLVDVDDEMRIVQKETGLLKPPIYIPHLFSKLVVEVVRVLRGDDRLEIGPRTSINAGLIARSSALLEGRNLVSYCDIKEGIYTAILGKTLYEDKRDVERKIDEVFPSISSYLEKNIPDVAITKLISQYRDVWGKDADWDAGHIKSVLTPKGSNSDWKKLSRWISKNETTSQDRMQEIISLYLSAYEKGCEKDGRLV
jgi:magnesium chelatase subunit I